MNAARVAVLVVLMTLGVVARGEPVTVSAAISLKDALSQVAREYEKSSGDVIKVNVGASGQLMEQIKAGAPVDVFISAGPGQVDELEKAGMVMGDTKRVVARNRLVLIVPAGQGGEIKGFEDLKEARIKRIAVGKPRAVPAGDYAMEVFEKLGLTAAVKGRLVYGANVRQVLDYVRRGEVEAGVVYATDAMEGGKDVTVVAEAPAGSHRPIEYVGVVIKDAKGAAAGRKFLEHLGSEQAQEVLKGKGFEATTASK